MSRTMLVTMVAVLGFVGSPAFAADPASGQPADGTAKAEGAASEEEIAYSIGYQVGKGIRQSGLQLDFDVVTRGVRDGAAGNEPAIGQAAVDQAYARYHKAQMEEQRKRRREKAQKNKAEGDAFLAENAKKDGVEVLPSGLQYKILQEGAGRMPQDTDKVRLHYRGTLIDGKQFDSSYDRGKPTESVLSRAIPGLREGLKLMKEGAKFQLFIPGELAYGEAGRGELVGPSTTLVYDVEFLGIVDQPSAPAAPASAAGAAGSS